MPQLPHVVMSKRVNDPCTTRWIARHQHGLQLTLSLTLSAIVEDRFRLASIVAASV